ncbi:MAG: hypothetical protein IIX68_07800, partial [Clostridia bacterium]|nr:hypothetical protein [Clostridia bacterium]
SYETGVLLFSEAGRTGEDALLHIVKFTDFFCLSLVCFTQRFCLTVSTRGRIIINVKMKYLLFLLRISPLIVGMVRQHPAECAGRVINCETGFKIFETAFRSKKGISKSDTFSRRNYI